MYIRMLFALMVLSIFSCTPEGGNPGKSLEEIQLEGASNSAIVRNPVSANAPTDTVNVARITFEETEFDFGDVDEGAIVEHVFRFKNTGKVPLLISDARSTCGCTVPVWPKAPIAPGQGGEISVKFDTKGKSKMQKKPVTILANTYPAATIVQLVGVVLGSDAKNNKPQ